VAFEQLGLWLKTVTGIADRIPWKRAIPLKLAVRGVRTKQIRANDGSVAFAMLPLWVANDSSDDAIHVRARLHWQRRGGGILEQNDTPGLWLLKVGSEMAGYRGVEETLDLPSNGDEQHLGLLAKPPGGRDAYIVAPGSYHQGQFPNYQHPEFALPPGEYELEIRLAARGGRKCLIRLDVFQPGTAGDPTATMSER
jgi:hypothetical protein